MLFTNSNLTLKIQLRKHDEVAVPNIGTRVRRGAIQ
jgi:hypothetical protein